MREPEIRLRRAYGRHHLGHQSGRGQYHKVGNRQHQGGVEHLVSSIQASMNSDLICQQSGQTLLASASAALEKLENVSNNKLKFGPINQDNEASGYVVIEVRPDPPPQILNWQ